MHVSRSGSFLNVSKFIVINLVIILIYLCYFPSEARKSMPLLIDDEQQIRLNRPGKLIEPFYPITVKLKIENRKRSLNKLRSHHFHEYVSSPALPTYLEQ